MLIACIPGAFANPAALSMSASPATGVPYKRSKSIASFARPTFGAAANGAAAGCISTMTGKSETGFACMSWRSAGSILSGTIDSARTVEAVGATGDADAFKKVRSLP